MLQVIWHEYVARSCRDKFQAAIPKRRQPCDVFGMKIFEVKDTFHPRCVLALEQRPGQPLRIERSILKARKEVIDGTTKITSANASSTGIAILINADSSVKLIDLVAACERSHEVAKYNPSGKAGSSERKLSHLGSLFLMLIWKNVFVFETPFTDQLHGRDSESVACHSNILTNMKKSRGSPS